MPSIGCPAPPYPVAIQYDGGGKSRVGLAFLTRPIGKHPRKQAEVSLVGRSGNCAGRWVSSKADCFG